MAEMLLKVGTVGPDPAYQDGDVLEVITDTRIRFVHASHICDVRQFGFTAEGLRPNSLAKTFYENTARYRFERLSESEVRRTEIEGGSNVVFSDTPHPTNGERIDVQFYLRRRLAHASHAIFGTLGAEVWYGGIRNAADADLDAIWAAIEAETAHRETAFTRFPRSPSDLRAHLALPLESVSAEEAAAFAASETEVQRINGEDVVVIVRKCARKADWRALGLPRSDGQIEDRSIEIDVRDEVSDFAKTTITEKAARIARR